MLSFCLETIFEGHGVRIFGAILFATYCYLGLHPSKICYLLHDILCVYIKYSHTSKKELGSFPVRLPKIIWDGLDIFGQ